MHTPAVHIRSSTWTLIRAELSRVAPDEGFAVPLVALRPADPGRNPCGRLKLVDLAGLLIAEAVLVPAYLQDNRPTRVRARARADQAVNAGILRLSWHHPRLRTCAHLHSHPFARGSTWPSSGPAGDIQGHLWPQLRANREAGLEAAFSFIACCDPAGADWRLQAFALTGAGRVIDLGLARELPDDSPAVRWALRGPLFCRRAFARLHWRFRRALATRGLTIRCAELFDGWHRSLVGLPGGDRVAVLTPLDYPARPIQFWAAPATGPARRMLPPWPRLAPPEAWADWLTMAAGRRYGIA